MWIWMWMDVDVEGTDEAEREAKMMRRQLQAMEESDQSEKACTLRLVCSTPRSASRSRCVLTQTFGPVA